MSNVDNNVEKIVFIIKMDEDRSALNIKLFRDYLGFKAFVMPLNRNKAGKCRLSTYF